MVRKQTLKLVKIKSISDVITNSSTEVFCIKVDEQFKQLHDSFLEVKFTLFNTEDDVKQFILPQLSDPYRLVVLFESKLFPYIDYYTFYEWVETSYNKLNKTYEEIYDWFKPMFNLLVGYALYIDDSDGWCSTNEELDLGTLKKSGYNSIGRY